LFSAYPTLSKRVSDLLDLQNERSTPKPGRNPLAYLIGLFCPGARYGVFGVALTVYMAVILCSIAIPGFVKARERAKEVRAAQQRMQSGEGEQSGGGASTAPSSTQ